jgi:hypothetical protein
MSGLGWQARAWDPQGPGGCWASLAAAASPQEAPQEAGTAGLAGGGHHGHRAAYCGEVRPAHTYPVPPLLHLPVLDPRLCPGAHLDCLALLSTVSRGRPPGLLTPQLGQLWGWVGLIGVWLPSGVCPLSC